MQSGNLSCQSLLKGCFARGMGRGWNKRPLPSVTFQHLQEKLQLNNSKTQASSTQNMSRRREEPEEWLDHFQCKARMDIISRNLQTHERDHHRGSEGSREQLQAAVSHRCELTPWLSFTHPLGDFAVHPSVLRCLLRTVKEWWKLKSLSFLPSLIFSTHAHYCCRLLLRPGKQLRGCTERSYTVSESTRERRRSVQITTSAAKNIKYVNGIRMMERQLLLIRWLKKASGKMGSFCQDLRDERGQRCKTGG